MRILVKSPQLPPLNKGVVGRFLRTTGVHDVCPPTKAQIRQRMLEEVEQRILPGHLNAKMSS